MQRALPLPGDVVWIRQRRWRVDRAARDRDVVRLDVSWRRRRRTFLEPLDRVVRGRAAGETVVRRQNAMARLAASIARTPESRLPLSVLDAAVDVLPHQLEPVLAVLDGHARVLIADEVGLGKTIQAAIVIAELVRRLLAPRILLVVPASLRDQWQTELVRRFDIDCLVGDRRHLDAVSLEGAFGANPWDRSGVWLTSSDFIKQPAVFRSLPRDPWDLVVIDEAHAVCGDSERFDACHALARQSRQVLLLTATPHSGDVARFARLIALGGHRVEDPPLIFRRTRSGLGLARARHVRWHRVSLSRVEAAALDAVGSFEREAIGASAPETADTTRLLISVFRKRALSTFAALAVSVSRRLLWLGGENGTAPWTQPRLLFDPDTDENAAEVAALTAAIGLPADRERWWLRRLKELADAAAAEDSKIRRLQALLSRTDEAVVVFSEFRDSLDAIVTRLRRDRTVTMIHGGQEAHEQRVQLDQYLSGAASVLLATDVAGQGLNLQSRGRWVICVELPWNPARLEQRLGRVDRIGQRRTPHLTILLARHAAESGVLTHLTRRATTAQRSFDPDLLSDVAPGGCAPDGTTPQRPAVALCRHWRRAGLVIAASICRRRSLAACWQGPVENAGLVVRSGGPAGTCLVVCSVSVLNELDELVQQERFALVAPAELCARRPADLKELASHAVGIGLRRRVARLRRSLRRSSQRRLAREHRLLERLAEERASLEGQPRLFDSSALSRHLDSVADLERRRLASQEHTARLQACSVLRAGEAEIDFVLGRSR